MDYVSATLTREEVIAYLTALPAVLSGLGLTDCTVMYGWDCDLDIDDLWQDQVIKVTDFSSFLTASIERGIFRPGSSDLFITSLDGAVSIRACHESDVHLSSSSDLALAALAAPIAGRHPEFTYKSGDSWQSRTF